MLGLTLPLVSQSVEDILGSFDVDTDVGPLIQSELIDPLTDYFTKDPDTGVALTPAERALLNTDGVLALLDDDSNAIFSVTANTTLLEFGVDLTLHEANSIANLDIGSLLDGLPTDALEIDYDPQLGVLVNFAFNFGVAPDGVDGTGTTTDEFYLTSPDLGIEFSIDDPVFANLDLGPWAFRSVTGLMMRCRQTSSTKATSL